eukprot:TRINITY_DN3706_c0_g1_i1.p1 TRINITY_DN3706_c0_g1~~TRINITY_DN3706_c0_g1_i1.p1  ORF type:complete len:140 (-),score=13.81 TRINITY_DN3706_c0_g1_i1:240-659(-)
MSVLGREKILEAIEAGEIKITPFKKENVGCASIDLTLSNQFRYYKPGLGPLAVKDDTNYKDITEKFALKEGECYLLLPGQACLGITEETIHLSPRICGLLEGRSRFVCSIILVVSHFTIESCFIGSLGLVFSFISPLAL